MSDFAFASFRNISSNARSAEQIALLRQAVDALAPEGTAMDEDAAAEASRLIQGVIVLLSCDENFVYRLHNAAAGLR